MIPSLDDFISRTAPRKHLKEFKVIFASRATKVWPCILKIGSRGRRKEGWNERRKEVGQEAGSGEVEGKEGRGEEDAGTSSSDLPNAGSPRRTKAD